MSDLLTAGEWAVHPQTKTTVIAGDRVLAWVQMDPDVDWRIVEADARVMAASKAMLAALAAIASQIHNLPRSATAEIIDQTARAAIGKATGGA
jgi:hypothetical protein